MREPQKAYIPVNDEVEEVEDRLARDVGMTGRVTVTEGEISEFFDFDEEQALECVKEAGHIAGEAGAQLEDIESGVFEVTFSLRPGKIAINDD